MHQLLYQYPKVFEYNEYLLVFLADHHISSLFGNFLGNCDQERQEIYHVQIATQSIWSHVIDNKHQFINSYYQYYDYPIWPSYTLSIIRLWHRYYSRWDIDSHPSKFSHEGEWHDDW